ncbi:MAG: hypothetical protein LBH47_00945 [Christensenellaceae bacterium]|jgi:hypothetical protein|nr:hypothetical protein [Christensenellaceae bacterium]
MKYLQIETDLFPETLPYINDKLKSCKTVTELGITALDSISNVIISAMKIRYLHDNLLIKNYDLIKILASFDIENDKSIAFSSIKITPIINLDGVYYFAIKTLKARWHSIVSLINDNVNFLSSKTILEEFITFLNANLR